MRIDTWIGNELSTIETDDVWGETFAHWDALVPTDTATAIANATVAILEASQTCDRVHPATCELCSRAAGHDGPCWSHPIAELARAIDAAPKIAAVPFSLTADAAPDAPIRQTDLFGKDRP